MYATSRGRDRVRVDKGIFSKIVFIHPHAVETTRGWIKRCFLETWLYPTSRGLDRERVDTAIFCVFFLSTLRFGGPRGHDRVDRKTCVRVPSPASDPPSGAGVIFDKSTWGCPRTHEAPQKSVKNKILKTFKQNKVF